MLLVVLPFTVASGVALMRGYRVLAALVGLAALLIEVLQLVLLSFVSILLAVVVGYLSRLLNRYDQTLTLGAMFGDEWDARGESEPAISPAHE